MKRQPAQSSLAARLGHAAGVPVDMATLSAEDGEVNPVAAFVLNCGR